DSEGREFESLRARHSPHQIAALGFGRLMKDAFATPLLTAQLGKLRYARRSSCGASPHVDARRPMIKQNGDGPQYDRDGVSPAIHWAPTFVAVADANHGAGNER